MFEIKFQCSKILKNFPSFFPSFWGNFGWKIDWVFFCPVQFLDRSKDDGVGKIVSSSVAGSFLK